MARPKVPYEKLRVGLAAVSRGVTWVEAARLAGISTSTLQLGINEHGVGVLRDRKPRAGAVTIDDREVIMLGIAAGKCNAEIARQIGKDRATVGREIARGGGRGESRAHRAHVRAQIGAGRPRRAWIETRPWLWEEVIGKLRLRWSPRQIAA